MAEHQVLSANWINEHQAKTIRRIADIALTAIDDETEDLAMDLTHTCENFNNDAHCEKCLDTMDKITDQIRRAVVAQMLGDDS